MKRTLVAICLLLSSPVLAQDDGSAGLFTKARQLPLVSQSVVVRVHGGQARVELTQVFANDGEEIAQADYRLHLPRQAVVTGFGFWHDGNFLQAQLKEREEAREDHRRAAGAGRPTAILRREGSIHPFSVYPVLAHSLQEVEVTITLPVVTERGRSSIRLPIDSFLGHARVASTVVAHIETRDKLMAVGVDGARMEERKRGKRSSELVFSTPEPVDIWWASEAPPLLVAAEAVPLDEGTHAIQLRLALNQGERSGESAPLALLIDSSYSMRRRGRALEALIFRIVDQASSPVRVFSVAEHTIEITSDQPRETMNRLFSGEAGFAASWPTLAGTADALGCGSPSLRCIAITDPQIVDLRKERSLEVLFLSDADELAHYEDQLGASALIHQPDVDAAGHLASIADELILPVLEVQSISQGKNSLSPPGSQRKRIAQGGLLRIFVESDTLKPLQLELQIDGRDLVRKVDIDRIDPETRLGRAVRGAYFSTVLDDWTREYRRLRDPELKRQIVAVSIREDIPSDLTALHVAAPASVLARTATPAPLLRLIGLILLFSGFAILMAIQRWPS